jgi:hypothetical protein
MAFVSFSALFGDLQRTAGSRDGQRTVTDRIDPSVSHASSQILDSFWLAVV